MPHPSGSLSAFARRDAMDKVMFGFVEGMRRGLKLALPGVTDDRVVEHVSVELALRTFATTFDLPPHEFNVSTQSVRYRRMVDEFYEDQRTKDETTA
jgi:hypothetical protein